MEDLRTGHQIISDILLHDIKRTSYKIALLRAFNDIARNWPVSTAGKKGVAIPLRVLAECWVAYYFPFVGERPILQGPRNLYNGKLTSDLKFREALTAFRQKWEDFTGKTSSPGAGYAAVAAMRRGEWGTTSIILANAYQVAIGSIADVIEEKPLRYAGEGQWRAFTRPEPYFKVVDEVAAIPTTLETDKCAVVPEYIWHTLVNLSPYIEALCVHSWAVFIETVDQGDSPPVLRGQMFELLSARPHSLNYFPL